MDEELLLKEFVTISGLHNQEKFPEHVLALLGSSLEKWLQMLLQSLGPSQVHTAEGAIIRGQVYIAASARIEPTAFIQGPAYIGPDTEIRHGAYIRGFFIAGDDCVVGHDTEVKNTIFLNHVHAAHFAYVGDSILGNQVNLGAGVVCANLKLNRKTIAIHWNGERIDTTFQKFGAVIGDGSQIGCNSVTNPGALLGKDVFCYPCTNIGGIIPSRSIVKPNTLNEIIHVE